MMLGLIASLLLCVGAPDALDGTFIQYPARYMRADAQASLASELDDVRRAGMSLIIVQRLAMGPRSFIPQPGEPDPTATIMAYADEHKMGVFLGLAEDSRWWQQTFDPVFVEEIIKRNIDIAREAFNRYGKHQSFAGWYIPLETWDTCPPDKIELIAGLFRRIADACRELAPGKPVAFAPFFTGNVAPEEVAALYGRCLELARLDILMLQDGVGARGWDDNVEIVKPYFKALKKVCKKADVALWADVECFTKDFKPCTPERLLKQMKVEAPFVRRMVTFEFFHYMSPGRGDAQRALYDGYMKSVD